MKRERAHALLAAIGGGCASQRELSRRTGLSLGGTNELLRALIGRGLVVESAVNGRARRYELTARGAAEKKALARATAKRVVLALLAEPDLPASAKRPASRLIAALA